MTGAEEWRPVVDWEERYEVSNLGRVRRLATGRIMRFARHVAGYSNVGLSPGVNTRTVHRLVGEAFLGPRPSGHQINHKNGDKTDNRLENLEYVTPSENVRHSLARTGGHLRCRDCGGLGHLSKTCARETQPGRLVRVRGHLVWGKTRVDGKNHCRKCAGLGHNTRSCGRPPKIKKQSGGQPGPRKRDPRCSFSLRITRGRIAVPFVVDTARETAVQAMIDRHRAAVGSAVCT